MAPISLKNTTPPTATTPWDAQQEDTRPLERRINELKATQNFINPKSTVARSAKGNKDAEALFTLYQALVKLRDIADYASDSKRTDTSRNPLDVLIQKGLGEIKNYMSTTALDKLDLLYGTKATSVTSIGLGRNETKYIGQQVLKTNKTDPIPGVVGNEVFTVAITKSGETENFTINLADIAGPITLQSLTDHVNSTISAVQTTNTDGELVAKYNSRFNVETTASGGFALAVSGMVGEQVTLTAATPEPSLFLVGTSKSSGTATSGTFTRLDGLDSGDPSRGFLETISGTGVALKEVPKEDKTVDALNGRTNAVVEKIRAQVADLYEELNITKDGTTALAPNVETTASAVAVDSKGQIFVIGKTAGDMGNDVNRADSGDVYLTKYDNAGNVVWQKLLGANGTADGFGLAIDANDNVIVAGRVDGTLTGSELFKGQDSFVTKFSNTGDQLWTQQVDSFGNDGAFAVTVDSNNDIIIGGQASGVFKSGLTYNGGTDAYVAKLTGTTGKIAVASQYGSAANESVKAIAIASDGNILVAAEENGQAVIRKLDANDMSTVLWSENVGDLGGGSITGIAVEGDAIYISGSTSNSSFGAGVVTATHQGSYDGFVVKLDDGGAAVNADWTTFVGTGSGDYIQGITVSGGQVYVAGRTGGDLGAARSGTTDAFAAKIDGASGTTSWIEQIGGTGAASGATGLAFSTQGKSILTTLGLGEGDIQVRETRTVQAQTTARTGDYFYISVNGGAKVKITIREGDTFEKIANRINLASYRHVKAEATIGGSVGSRLKIGVKNGGEIQLIAGDGDRDALKSLGLEPTKIFDNAKLFGIGTDKNAPKELGGVFGFKLEDGLTASTERGAKYLLGKLNDAIAEVQRSYRSLYHDPIADLLKQQSSNTTGTVPAHLQKQLSNYSNGLNRLLAGSGTYI